jgi:hypothetical protein
MAFGFSSGWDSSDNNNGATADEITAILKTAKYCGVGRGDSGLMEALSNASDTVTVEKGIHSPGPHIRLAYLGGTWHADLLDTASGGRAGYRVSKTSQFKS